MWLIDTIINVNHLLILLSIKEGKWLSENLYKEIINNNVRLRILYDRLPESPRSWDNLGIMVCWHRRYDLGDRHNFCDSYDLFQSLIRDVLDKTIMKEMIDFVKSGKAERLNLVYNKSSKEWELRTYYQKWYVYHTFPAPLDYQDDSLVDMIIDTMGIADLLRFLEKYYVILPVYLYDHTVQRISTGSFVGRAVHAEWDSGQVGWIYCSKQRFIDETGYSKNELFSTDTKRKPAVKERVKIANRSDYGQVIKITNNKIVIDFDHNKIPVAKSQENIVTVDINEITEVLSNQAIKMLESEIEIYDQYINGEVYGYELEEEKVCHYCGHAEYEHIDSCYGFYGDDFEYNGLFDSIPKEYRHLVNDLKVA